MEWVSIKPSYTNGTAAATQELEVFSQLAKAGFHLEMMRRNVNPAVVEYFYFHPLLHIQVHEVQEPEGETSQFFIFYPDGRTAFITEAAQLQEKLSVSRH
jgi:hypothetical protein